MDTLRNWGLLIIVIIFGISLLIFLAIGLQGAKELRDSYRYSSKSNYSSSSSSSTSKMITIDCIDCKEAGIEIYLRELPDGNSKVIASVPHGTKCKVESSGISKVDNRKWYMVDCGGYNYGWIVYTLDK